MGQRCAPNGVNCSDDRGIELRTSSLQVTNIKLQPPTALALLLTCPNKTRFCLLSLWSIFGRDQSSMWSFFSPSQLRTATSGKSVGPCPMNRAAPSSSGPTNFFREILAPRLLTKAERCTWGIDTRSPTATCLPDYVPLENYSQSNACSSAKNVQLTVATYNFCNVCLILTR